MSLISLLTINTHNGIQDLLALDWLTLKTQHKLYIDFEKEMAEQRAKNGRYES